MGKCFQPRNHRTGKSGAPSDGAFQPADQGIELESSRLSLGDRARAASIAIESGARFLVTGTGYGDTNASEVRAWREVIGTAIGLKAVGGIKDTDGAMILIEAGADRLGTMEGPAILRGFAGGNGSH